MRFSIGKTQHYRKADKEEEVIAETDPPFVVTLVPDPENRHDPNAIKVMCKRQHIGFVPSTHTHLVTAGPATFVKRESGDGWIIEAPDAAEASHNAVPAPLPPTALAAPAAPPARTKARAAPAETDLTEDAPTPPAASAPPPPVAAPVPPARTKARAAPVEIDLTEDELTPATASAPPPPVTAPAPTMGTAGAASGAAPAEDAAAAAEAKAEAEAKRLAKLRRKREEQAVESPSKAPRT